MGAISEGFRESPRKGVAKVSGRTRSSREYDRSLRARPGPLSRFSGERKYPVSLGHSSDDRSLHSEHHSARGSEGFEKGDGSKKHSRERHSQTPPHVVALFCYLPSKRGILSETPPAPAYRRARADS